MTEEILFCKQCRAPKYVKRDYCCYCVGRYFIAKDTFRNRLAYRFMSPQKKSWYAFQTGLAKQYPSLIPEHLRKGEWLDIEEINRPTREAE